MFKKDEHQLLILGKHFTLHLLKKKYNVLLHFFDFCFMKQVLDLSPVANDGTLAFVKPTSHVWEF